MNLIRIFSPSRSQSGFTLIELLTCCAIVSVLMGNCVQVFKGYKQRAFDSQAESALRNAITAEEALFADNESYADCVDAACETVLPGFRLSPMVTLSIQTKPGAGAYGGISSHPAGAHVFEVDSEVGSVTSS